MPGLASPAGLAVYHNERAIQNHSKQNTGFPL